MKPLAMKKHFSLGRSPAGCRLPFGLLSMLWVIVGAAGFASPATAAVRPASTVQVADLRCEYLKDPLGLDVAWPRLSWKLVPTDPKERGQRQRT